MSEVSRALVDRQNKLLIIGAGPVGLGMAAALKLHAIPYEQVDASDGIGGNWRHGVYTTTHIISSKRSTAYADYPMPAEYPDFPSAAQMLAYLESYARDRGLLSSIRLNKKVVKAFPLPDDRWRVDFEGGEFDHLQGRLGLQWSPLGPPLSRLPRHVRRANAAFQGLQAAVRRGGQTRSRRRRRQLGLRHGL